MRPLTLLCVLALLAACASGPDPISPDAPAASRGSEAGATPAVTAPRSEKPVPASSPVDSLLEEARRLRAARDLAGSLTRLDRALRIDPQNAGVYLELARTHAAAGRVARASASAERGLLYCRGAVCRQLRRFIDS